MSDPDSLLRLKKTLRIWAMSKEENHGIGADFLPVLVPFFILKVIIGS
jgi:hypothetical protein